MHGEVLRVDRFGNLVTNIDRRTFDAMRGPAARDPGRRACGERESSPRTPMPRAGEICALFGSTDHLEIAANGASAAALLDLGRGAPVQSCARDSMTPATHDAGLQALGSGLSPMPEVQSLEPDTPLHVLS